MERNKTVLELILNQMMNTYYWYKRELQQPITLKELYQQQPFVFNNLKNLRLKACFEYIKQLNCNPILKEVTKPIILDKSKLRIDNPNNVIKEV